MYWNDHPPAHFHAFFAEHRAVIDIETLDVTSGQLARSKVGAVLRWAAPRRAELLEAWNRVQMLLPQGRIE
jgi:Domain of unknown function (DUF4160)